MSPKTAQSQESTACEALVLYEPLCGLWGWDVDPDVEKINSAACDWNGYLGLRAAEGKHQTLAEQIVAPLADAGLAAARVHEGQVRAYLERVIAADTARTS